MKCGADVSGQQGNVATAMMPVAEERDAEQALLEMLKSATLGEYEILRELGRGGMATVYLAHDIALDRKVAIKVMSPALLLMGEGMVERFRREARTAASLSHPHIIPIYTVKSSGKLLYFVMKFIPGRSLEAVMRDEGPLPIPVVKAVLQQVGSALGFAHRHGIVHRDVKPANIMLDEEGWAVVTDFGIAKVAENRGLTMTGIAVGTPSYMSPEQCAAKGDLTGKSDQYSLGVVAYEMLCGKQPFEGDSAMAIMFAHFHEQPRPLADLRPECPPDLAAAVMRMLEKQPERRWPSLEDMLAAIAAAPLAHDDPTHRRMQELARRGSNREILASVPLPPTSPIPPGRRDLSDAATTPIPAPRVVSVSVAPARSDLPVGDRVQLAAAARLANGAAAEGAVRWTTSDPAVAVVSETGLVTAIAPGTATITAAAEEVTGAATVVVTPVAVGAVLVNPGLRSLGVGDTVRLAAEVRDTRGAALAERRVAWSSSNPGVAAVDGGGLVTALAPGNAEIAATCEGVRGTARIAVTPAAVASLALEPASLHLAVGATAGVAAQPRDARGHLLKGRTVEWASAHPAIASVSAQGVVVGQAPGATRITARCEGVTAELAVEVAPAPVASVTVAAPDPLIVGARIRLAAVVKDAGGKTVTGRPVTWLSSAPAVAAVAPDGTVSAVAPGSARITAECEGKSWTVPVTVLPVPVAAVQVTGMPDMLPVGGSATLAVLVKDGRGNALAGRRVEWRSSEPRVATVTPDGVVTARAPGRAVIAALVEGKEATAALTVVTPVPPPPPSPVEAPPGPEPAPSGARAPEPPVGVAPARAAGASEAATEIIRPVPARAPSRRLRVLIGVAGVAVVALGGYLLSGRGSRRPVESPATVVEAPPAQPAPVAPAPVATVTVTAPSGPIAVGRTLQLAALLRDSAGRELESRPITWSSSDPAIASVDASGAVQARQAGTVRITATSEGRTGEVELAIEPAAEAPAAPPAVAAVSIAPVAGPLEVGGEVRLAVAVKDGKGNSLTDRTVVWSSSAPAIATVSAGGVVSARAPGTVTITASSEGKSGSLRLTVSAPPPAAVASVTLAPEAPVILVGQTVQLVATVLDERRSRLERPIAWSSSDPAVARVDQQGLVTGVGKGSATIAAGANGKSASVRVTVNEPPPQVVPVASVVLNAATRSIRVGETTTWTAAARDRSGNTLADRRVTWSSSDPRVATVSNGVITGLAPGRAEIAAEVDGRKESARILVEAAPAPPPPGLAPVAAPAASALLPRRAVAAGGLLSCGLASSSAVCWGGGETAPGAVSGTAGATQVVVGRAHACALAPGGRAVCWGENRNGQLGDGTTTARTEAVPVAGDLAFSTLSAGAQHTCGVADGRAYCWGENENGQLGDGSTTDRRRPTQVRLKEPVTEIAAGGKHTCALTASGKAWCWGDGFSGQLGVGSLDQQAEPIEVSGPNKWAAITAGGEHTCALATTGAAFCWGGNRSGQLGDGSTSDRSRPVPVASGSRFTAITAGGAHTCGLAAGEAYCWGDNRAGQLGDGTKTARPRPVALSAGARLTTISAGGRHSCGLTENGEPLCWGDNEKGQLGDGGTAARETPAPVRAPR
jgi:uncharacterized protein YjdB